MSKKSTATLPSTLAVTNPEPSLRHWMARVWCFMLLSLAWTRAGEEAAAEEEEEEEEEAAPPPRRLKSNTCTWRPAHPTTRVSAPEVAMV